MSYLLKLLDIKIANNIWQYIFQNYLQKYELNLDRIK